MKTIKLPFRLKKPVLACGADMKGAFALATGDKAHFEEGFGDLADPDNLERYAKAVGSLIKRLQIRPKAIVCDMHPGYYSTRFAGEAQRKMPGSRLYTVQHHEAHIASSIVDNSIKGDVVGVAFDGTGYGSDGSIWGGEFFVGNPKDFRRAAHLEYVPMPGGETVIRQPWRMAASYLYKAFGSGFAKRFRDKGRAALIRTMIDKGLNSPLTSSVGRLFDAAGSLILEKDETVFEAELPIGLEKIVPFGYEERYEFDVVNKAETLIFCLGKTFKAIARDVLAGVDKSLISGRFHNTVVDMTMKTAARLATKAGLKKIVLSGGVFQNRYLSEKLTGLLERNGYTVYRHRAINTNDSGIPIGQIAIAQARGICA